MTQNPDENNIEWMGNTLQMCVDTAQRLLVGPPGKTEPDGLGVLMLTIDKRTAKLQITTAMTRGDEAMMQFLLEHLESGLIAYNESRASTQN